MKRSHRFIIVLSCTLAMCVYAQHPESEKAARQCTKTEKELDIVYRYLMDAYGQNENAKSALKKTQLAWTNYRDAEAKASIVYPYGGAGGHPQSIAYSRTRMELARERTARLKKQLEFVYNYKQSNAQDDKEMERIRHMLDQIKKMELI